MNHVPLSQPSAAHRLKLFLALSRTPHGLLDLATPGLAALLCLGGFPPARVLLLGIITVFAGYTAVYALNDLVDYRTDIAKIKAGRQIEAGYLDGVLVRHPMAQGLLSFREGLLWALAWTAVALTGAYLLNPVCALIFLAGAILETVYCLMLRVSHWRTLVSGVVKTLGGIAAAFAVNPQPSPVFLVLLFLWIFTWEIGGQNVPNDWHDLEEDLRWRAQTIPVRYGAGGSARVILASLGATVLLLPLLQSASPLPFSWHLKLLSLAAGLGLLILPAWRLYLEQERSRATALFNCASYYPLVILFLTLPALLV
uniref:Ubiquinone biosynthesis protein UbiA n=1 Tax=Desulfobacca acetoxidans TaxID=60893 RepID=A0A7V6A5I3_9BACT